MKPRLRHALASTALFAGAALAAAPAGLEAQQVCRVQPPVDVSRIMVPTLRSSDRGLATEAADVIRERLGRDFNCRDLLVISRNDIHNVLTASGYRTDTALSPQDARQLGQLIRADEYVTGDVNRTPEGFRAELNLVLTRDNAFVQPLPPITGRRIGDIAVQASRQIRDARRQVDAERRCYQAYREERYAEAIAAADQGIQAYPQATLARLCKAVTYKQMGQPTDSVLAITNEILQIHPRSRIALQLAAEAYEETEQDERAVQAWTTLIATDPTNAGLIERATRYLVTSGNAQMAKPIIEEAVQANPGDPSLQRLRWLVLLTIRDWEGAIRVGEELARTDTAIADTTFFRQLVTAYAADSQFVEAAQTAERGTQKFPDNATLYLLAAQNYRAANQAEPALRAARRAVELDPAVPQGYAQLARLQMEAGNPDEALAALRASLQHDPDSAFIGSYALSLGGQVYQRASASQEREDWLRVMPFFALADSLAPSNQAKFLLGLSAFRVAESALQEASRTRSCELAELGQENMTRARASFMAGGGQENPETAGQVMQWLQQAQPAAQNQVRQFCRDR